MTAAFSSMHGRVLSHATEQPERVEQAIQNVFRDSELEVKRTVGHHGNPIIVVEASTTSMDVIAEMLQRLQPRDIEALLTTLEDRIDDSCNLFVRLDKQSAFAGEIRLADNDDAIAIRIKVRAFPAKKASAIGVVSETLEQIAGKA